MNRLIAGWLMLFLAYSGLAGGAYAASEYRLPQIKTLENGFRYTISPSLPGDATISFDLIQEISAQDEMPGEEGFLLLYKAIPTDVMLPDAQLLASQYPGSFNMGHGRFGGQPQILSSLMLEGLPVEAYGQALDLLARAARYTAPSSDALDAGYQAALGLMGRANNLGQSHTFKGGSMMVQMETSMTIESEQLSAFLNDRPLSVFEAQRAPSATAMRAFLERVIAPKRSVLVVSGPMDVAAMERAIVAAFSDWQPASAAAPVMRDVVVPQGFAKSIISMTDKNPRVVARFQTDFGEKSDNLPLLDRKMRRAVASYLSDYLRSRLEAEGMGVDKNLRVSAVWEAQGFDITLSKIPARQAARIMPTLLREIARLRQHGLPRASVQAVKTALGQAHSLPAKKKSGPFAMPGSYFMARGEGFGPFVDAGFRAVQLMMYTNSFFRPSGGKDGLTDQQFKAYQARVAGLDLAQVNRVARRMLTGDLSKVVPLGDTNAAALFVRLPKRYAAFLREELEPPVEERGFTFAYSDFGTPGRVVAREEIAELNSWKLTFANNVVLFHHHEPDAGPMARYEIAVGDAGAYAGNEGQALLLALTRAESQLPLGRHATEEIEQYRQQISAFKSDNVTDYGVLLSPRIFMPSANGELPQVLDYAAARLSDSQYDRAVFERVIAGLAERDTGRFTFTPNSIQDPYGVLPTEFGGWDDAAPIYFGVDEKDAPSVERAIAAQKDLLEQQAVRIVYSGETSLEDVTALVARTLGALDKRRPLALPKLKAPPIAIPVGQTVSTAMKGEMAGVGFAYPISLDVDAEREKARQMLVDILSETLKECLKAAGLGGAGDVSIKPREGYRSGHMIWARVIADLSQIASAEAIMADLFATPDLLSAQSYEAARDKRVAALSMSANWGSFEPIILSSLGYKQRQSMILPGMEQAIIDQLSIEDLKRAQAADMRPENRFIVRFGY